jgi:MFS family permease
MTLTVAQVRRRYLFLYALRWLPTGLVIPVYVLLMLDRGLTLAEIGVVGAVLGVVGLVLEVPTGGLADAVGRRPVLVLANVASIGSLLIFAVADTLEGFVLGTVLHGVFRALDSGPLDAWYVDCVVAVDPTARIEVGLSRAGATLSGAIAVGALSSSGLVLLNPVPAIGPLTVPVLAAAALYLLGMVAIVALVTEARHPHETRQRDGDAKCSTPSGLQRMRNSLIDVPDIILDAIRLVRRSRILLGLLVAELLWAVGSVTFEVLMPPRLAEVVGDAETAAAVMGPAGSAAWVASALGAGLAPIVSRRVGVPLAAAILRVAQGATVVAMGLLAGPIGVVAAFVGTYLIHGAANPLHQTLLHQQVDGPYRATVLSLNEMMGRPGIILGSVALTAVADRASVSAAMVLGAVVMAAAAPLYLPARRRLAATGRSGAATTGRTASGADG